MSAPLLRPLARAARTTTAVPVAAFSTMGAARAGFLGVSGAADVTRPLASSSQGGVDARIFGGVPGFLGAPEMGRLQDWQSGLWARLQDEVRNHPKLAPVKQKWDTHGIDVTELLSLTAREPALARAFNYAALLLNNSYFLEGIKHDGAEHAPAEYADLTEKLEAYAEGIVGGAWLWLVKDTTNQNLSTYDIVPTYAAGTLLVASRAQKGRDPTLPLYATPADSGAGAAAALDPASPAAAAAGTPAAPRPAAQRYTTAASPVKPLAVLNLYETAYLGDAYGVWGRRQYAKDWFARLDWAKVQDRSLRTV
ncbi:hypothetical protein Q5752_000611 [Cryptotrichosporon argae]